MQRQHSILFRIGQKNRNIFEALRAGTKKVETRAATSRYKNLQKGDSVSFLCEGERLEKEIASVMYFAFIDSLLKKYKPMGINPAIETKEDIVKMYHSFPGYEEKIKEFGIVALEFT